MAPGGPARRDRGGLIAIGITVFALVAGLWLVGDSQPLAQPSDPFTDAGRTVLASALSQMDSVEMIAIQRETNGDREYIMGILGTLHGGQRALFGVWPQAEANFPKTTTEPTIEYPEMAASDLDAESVLSRMKLSGDSCPNGDWGYASLIVLSPSASTTDANCEDNDAEAASFLNGEALPVVSQGPTLEGLQAVWSEIGVILPDTRVTEIVWRSGVDIVPGDADQPGFHRTLDEGAAIWVSDPRASLGTTPFALSKVSPTAVWDALGQAAKQLGGDRAKLTFDLYSSEDKVFLRAMDGLGTAVVTVATS